MIFFYLGYWWFTRGRPYVQRLTIGLIAEVLRVSAALFLIPPERAFPEPGTIALNYVIHLAAVAAFLALMHFSGKAIRARNLPRDALTTEQGPAAQSAEPPLAASALTTSSDTGGLTAEGRTRHGRRPKVFPALIAALIGFAAVSAMLAPSVFALYGHMIEARTQEQVIWGDELNRPHFERAVCDAVSGSYVERLSHDYDAISNNELDQTWNDVAANMPGDTGLAYLVLREELKTKIRDCRSGLTNEDVGESTGFRKFREQAGLQYVELATRLDRPGYLEGAMLAHRSLEQFCPTAFDTIECSSLMPNVPMLGACIKAKARSASCKTRIADREAALLAVLTCESSAAKRAWGESAIDRAENFAAHLSACIIPAEKANEAVRRAASAADLFQQHLTFSGAASLGAALLLASISLAASAPAGRGH